MILRAVCYRVTAYIICALIEDRILADGETGGKVKSHLIVTSRLRADTVPYRCDVPGFLFARFCALHEKAKLIWNNSKRTARRTNIFIYNTYMQNYNKSYITAFV